MYKIDRRGGWGGVQKSYTRTDPTFQNELLKISSIHSAINFQIKIFHAD